LRSVDDASPFVAAGIANDVPRRSIAVARTNILAAPGIGIAARAGIAATCTGTGVASAARIAAGLAIWLP
jgi:succinate dehydrogenase/fumarate reductase flavoprotein subunit